MRCGLGRETPLRSTMKRWVSRANVTDTNHQLPVSLAGLKPWIRQHARNAAISMNVLWAESRSRTAAEPGFSLNSTHSTAIHSSMTARLTGNAKKSAGKSPKIAWHAAMMQTYADQKIYVRVFVIPHPDGHLRQRYIIIRNVV